MSAFDPKTLLLLEGVFVLLAVASLIGWILARRVSGDEARRTVENLNARTRAWWVMCAVFALALALGPIGSTALFAVSSFFALREYITLTLSSRADHRALFWSFFVILPLQYLLVLVQWYGLFSVFIPVYAFLFVPIRLALAGETEEFLERCSRIQWGLMVCVYFVSYVPALLMLEIPGFYGENGRLLFFLVTIVQLSDVFQYVWGKMIGKRKIAPSVSPNKTVEGFVGGTLSATMIGTCLWWATPFSPLQAFLLSTVITVMGFFGGLTMSAIKRARGVKDFGAMIEGHGGMLDRIDSICFAAPVFFHLVRFFFAG